MRFGGAVASVLSQAATSLTVRTPAGTGTVAISVANPDGGTITRSSAFTYQSSTQLTVTSLSPTSGNTSGGTDVVITGSNFQNGVVVRFGTLAAAVSSVTSTRLVARTPAQAKGRSR